MVALPEEEALIKSLVSSEELILMDQTEVEIANEAKRGRDENLELDVRLYRKSENHGHKYDSPGEKDHLVCRTSDRLDVHLFVQRADLLSLRRIAQVLEALVHGYGIDNWQKNQSYYQDDWEYSLAQRLSSLEVDKRQRGTCGDKNLQEAR